MAEELKSQGNLVVTLGKSKGSNIQLKGKLLIVLVRKFSLNMMEFFTKKRLNLIGGFQAENVLMAAALVISLGSEPQDVFNVLHNLITVRGRMELAASRANGASVFVRLRPYSGCN